MERVARAGHRGGQRYRHLALQLAKALGAARVVAAVGSADKAGFVRQCGADEVVTYSQPSWGDPVDPVLDGVGGELVQRGVDALAPFGRLVAFSAGGGTVDAGSLLGGLKSVIGFSIGLVSPGRHGNGLRACCPEAVSSLHGAAFVSSPIGAQPLHCHVYQAIFKGHLDVDQQPE